MSVALVTGGSRGIGRAICVALAEAGYSVAINYAGSQSAAEETLELCEQATAANLSAPVGESDAPKHAIFQADVADAEQVDALFAAVEAQLGSVLALVNNAGITRDNLLLRMSSDDFDAVIATNLKGAFNCCKRAARPMTKARAGRIINISSIVGLTGNAGQANYAASKAGLIGLTKSIAKELASRNITANCVAPGFITTEMTAVLSDDVKSAMLETIPLKRTGSPADIANTVRFLASDQAAYITGQVISVDGGMAI
jgi:3-oxoacyl-[acyl-carrier protein] reductase